MCGNKTQLCELRLYSMHRKMMNANYEFSHRCPLPVLHINPTNKRAYLLLIYICAPCLLCALGIVSVT